MTKRSPVEQDTQVIPFKGPPDGEAIAEMTLFNMTAKYVVYKIKSNQFPHMKSAPSAVGIVSPGEQYMIELSMPEGFNWAKKTVILLQSAYLQAGQVQPGVKPEDIWKKVKNVTNTQLKGVFEPLEMTEAGHGDDGRMAKRQLSDHNLTTIIMDTKGQQNPKVFTDITARHPDAARMDQSGPREAVAELAVDEVWSGDEVGRSCGSTSQLPGTMARLSELPQWAKAQPKELIYPITFMTLISGWIGLVIGIVLSR